MLESKRLYFRPFNYDDYDELFLILSNPNVCKFLPGKVARNEEQITKWLNHFIRSVDDEFGNKQYAIVEKETNRVIGYGGLGYVREFDNLEIMFGFNEDVWGKGYGTETSLFMRDHAKELGIDFLIALADVENIKSQKILLHTGFKEIKKMELWGLTVYYYEMKL